MITSPNTGLPSQCRAHASGPALHEGLWIHAVRVRQWSSPSREAVDSRRACAPVVQPFTRGCGFVLCTRQWSRVLHEGPSIHAVHARQWSSPSRGAVDSKRKCWTQIVNVMLKEKVVSSLYKFMLSINLKTFHFFPEEVVIIHGGFTTADI